MSALLDFVLTLSPDFADQAAMQQYLDNRQLAALDAQIATIQATLESLQTQRDTLASGGGSVMSSP